jgi:hypothetical protein
MVGYPQLILLPPDLIHEFTKAGTDIAPQENICMQVYRKDTFLITFKMPSYKR